MNGSLRSILSVAAVGLALCAVSRAQAGSPAFEVVVGNDSIPALDRPRSEGAQVIFHRYPDGMLTSVRKSAIARVLPVAGSAQTELGAPSAVLPEVTEAFPMSASEKVLVTARGPGLQPGEVRLLGETAAPRLTARMASPATSGRAGGIPYVPRPGEGLPGKALFNPNRDYRPDWDSTLVPGYSMPFSNSRDDYVEGRTLAYPPGNGLQQGSGYPPVVIDDGAEPPMVLSRRGGWSPPVVDDSINPPTTADRGSDVPLVPDVHDLPRMSYDPNLPPPGQEPGPPED